MLKLRREIVFGKYGFQGVRISSKLNRNPRTASDSQAEELPAVIAAREFQLCKHYAVGGVNRTRCNRLLSSLFAFAKKSWPTVKNQIPKF